MKLQDVFNNHQSCQVVLSLTNNNEVFITSEDFNPNSKFYRMSKVRLSVDFELSGIIQDGVFIRTTDYALAINSNAIIYRTYRGKKKNDYVLYIYQGEYKLIEHYKKCVSYKKLIESTKDRVVAEPKYNTPPTPDKVLRICPHITTNNGDKSYYVSFKHNDFPCEYLTKQYTYSYNDVNAYLKATVFGLTVAKKYVDRISKIEVYHPDNEYSKGVYMFATGNWRAKRSMSKIYVNTIHMLKREFQEYGISICFME